MLILILACILVVLILGGIWLYTTREYIKNDIYSSDIQDSRHMVESVSMYLDDIIHNVDIISHSPDTVTSLRGNDTKGLKQIADNLNMSTPKPDAIVIIDNNGQILYGTRSTNLTNITQYYWYNDMAKSKGAYITGLYNSAPLKDYAFAILTPVQNNGTIVGRIMAVFTPESFQESLKEHNLDPRDNIIVVDS